jgi:6-pyruvoyl-tetrahydropterin synthase
LILKFEFRSAHSLEDYETPHFHGWRVEAVVSGEPVNGKIADMVSLRESFGKSILPLHARYLNEHPALDAAARRFPTCETLGAYFFRALQKSIASEFRPENPTTKLESVLVALCEDDGFERGAARIRE